MSLAVWLSLVHDARAQSADDYAALEEQVAALAAELERLRAMYDGEPATDPHDAYANASDDASEGGDVYAAEADAEADADAYDPAFEAQPFDAVASEPPATELAEALGHRRTPIDATAGLLVATAYANRGINQFGASQSSLAGLVGPSLELARGPLTLGWFGAFQATGSRRDEVVREGLGHEQNVYATAGFPLFDDLSLEGGLLATAYPFAAADVAGAEVPLFLEPSLGLTWERRVALSLGLMHSQGVQAGLGGYTYLTGGVSYTSPVHEAVDVVVGATGGAKRWLVGPQGQANTFDADLSWGARITTDHLEISPVGHLTWTNLPGLSAGGETFAWLGIETLIGL